MIEAWIDPQGCVALVDKSHTHDYVAWLHTQTIVAKALKAAPADSFAQKFSQQLLSEEIRSPTDFRVVLLDAADAAYEAGRISEDDADDVYGYLSQWASSEDLHRLSASDEDLRQDFVQDGWIRVSCFRELARGRFSAQLCNLSDTRLRWLQECVVELATQHNGFDLATLCVDLEVQRAGKLDFYSELPLSALDSLAALCEHRSSRCSLR